MEISEIIKLLESERQLLQLVNSSGDTEKLSGYEIAALIDSFLQENQVKSPDFLIKVQSQALYEGDKKIFFTDVKNRILTLGSDIKELEKISTYAIEPPKQKSELNAKLELILKIKDFIKQRKLGYVIVALIDSYANLLDINSIRIIVKIREYAYKRGIKPLSLTQDSIDKQRLSSIFRKSILSLNEKIYRNKRFPKAELQPEKEQIVLQKKILKQLNQVNTNTKTIKDIQTTFLCFFILEFIISFVLGYMVGAGI